MKRCVTVTAAIAISMICGSLAAQPASSPGVVTCDGIFAPQASEASFIAALSAANVAWEETTGHEDIPVNISALFPRDPSRRLEVLWLDENKRRGPAAIWISGQSRWTVGNGVRVGASVADVENLNGKPFLMRSLNTDYGGTVTDWQGGKLGRRNDVCKLSMQFTFEDDPETFRKLPEGEFLKSDDPAVRQLKGTVAYIYLTYPY